MLKVWHNRMLLCAHYKFCLLC